MAKSLRTFLEDCRREIPNEVVHIEKEVDPAHFDVTAIIKHLGAMKKFPILIFDHPLNLHGKPSEIKLVMNSEISQGKCQIALGVPKEMSRERMAEICLEREDQRIPPIVVEKKEAPVKEVIKVGKDVDIFEIPIMRHHYMDGGPYITLSTISRDPNN
ncbi:MAG: UbiD family decarboxylase, partial [Deltaproteobacteria bacterium]|nr:UbiD family decarboxylase [Deltaproteobacteria bacterium]